MLMPSLFARSSMASERGRIGIDKAGSGDPCCECAVEEMPCALPIVDPPIAERTQPPPIDLPPRGIQRCDDPRAGFGAAQKEAKASAIAAAREYHGIIKSNQRWSGPAG